MDPTIVYETQAGPWWDWRVAADLFCGGAGVGALLFAIGIHAAYGDRYRRICGTAAALAPALVLAGLGLLALEMGRPRLVGQVFTHFAPTSALWWGGLFQAVLVLGALPYAALCLRPSEANRRVRSAAGWLLAPVALVVGAYHGLLLGVVQARPLWHEGPTVVAALLAVVATGVAAVMVVHLARMALAGRLVEGRPLDDFLHDLVPVRNLLVAALALQAGAAALWWLDLRLGDPRAAEALEVANAAFGRMFWGGGVGLGLIAPLVLGAYAVARSDALSGRRHAAVIAVTSGLVLLGAWFFRLAVVLGGQLPLSPATL